ncbi:hypothetical protein [Kitasatospora purpeofusca]|uniref:hypothetical protein n=1 Tax=Kitasatospora purpeofusca TaxID=67352 RepID=UPI002A5A5E46|nr:hypothetical protein [Kitasatospora purpeofusca]MDY0816238.1 hypothetical protein [Kitasatospora purpeofusca]
MRPARTARSSPELEAAARAALQGSPKQLRAFLQTGQYTAKRKDALAATHQLELDRLLTEGDAAAALAQQSSAQAAQAAALAAGAVDQANSTAAAAGEAAGRAAGFVVQAQQKAKAAEASANRAVESAKTATAAEAAARSQMAAALNSARHAKISATKASVSAAQAHRASQEARASYEAANNDANAAAEASARAAQAYLANVADFEAYRAEDRKRSEDFWKSAIPQMEAEKQADAEKREIEAAIRKELEDPYRGYQPVSGRDLVLAFTHGVLDGVGTFGGVVAPGAADLADLLNCGIYAMQRDAENATSSCLGAIPILGDLKAVTKVVDWIKAVGPISKKVIEFLENVFRKVPGSCLVAVAHSFPAGTKVLMADGSRKSIEKVRTGDRVLATDPDTGHSPSRSKRRSSRRMTVSSPTWRYGARTATPAPSPLPTVIRSGPRRPTSGSTLST